MSQCLHRWTEAARRRNANANEPCGCVCAAIPSGPMSNSLRPSPAPRGVALLIALVTVMSTTGTTQSARPKFHLEEATIASIQEAIRTKQITTVSLVELYLKRIKAYNSTCVNEPQGILGPITTIPNAGQINALSTLNPRPTPRTRSD